MTATPQEQMVRSADDTLIATCKTGQGTPVLLCNGVGANLALWRPVLDRMSDDHAVITWDMRGMFGSGSPPPDKIGPADHAEDALAAARAWGADRFNLVGWSSGGRIALEVAAKAPEAVAGLALVCAGYGHPLGALLKLDLTALLPRLAGIGRNLAVPLHGVLKRFLVRPEVVGLVRQSGAIGASADTTAFIAFLQGLSEVEPRLLFRTYHAVSGDPAPHLLERVEAPTLVIAGDSDRFTSPAITSEIVTTIAGARLETYLEATHYLPIEHPGRLAADLTDFFSATPLPRS